MKDIDQDLIELAAIILMVLALATFSCTLIGKRHDRYIKACVASGQSKELCEATFSAMQGTRVY